MSRCAAVLRALVCVAVVSAVLAQLNGPNRPQTIGNIFQIPIQTLTAISNVAQNTRPIGQILQQRPQRFRPETNYQQPDQQMYQQQGVYQQPYQRPGVYQQSLQLSPGTFSTVQSYLSRAARIAGLYTAADGSGFRI